MNQAEVSAAIQRELELMGVNIRLQQFRSPRYTTAELPAVADIGDQVFDTSTQQFKGYDGSGWVVLSGMGGVTALVGEVVWMATTIVDTALLLADGAAVIPGTHPVLHAQLVTAGNPHGTSGGNPRLPSLVGKFPAGAGGAYALGSSGGVDTVTLAAAESGVNGSGSTTSSGSSTSGGPSSVAHKHGFSAILTQSGSGGETWGNGTVNRTDEGVYSPLSGGLENHTHSNPNHAHPLTARAADDAHENRPPYVALLPYVRAA